VSSRSLSIGNLSANARHTGSVSKHRLRSSYSRFSYPDFRDVENTNAPRVRIFCRCCSSVFYYEILQIHTYTHTQRKIERETHTRMHARTLASLDRCQPESGVSYLPEIPEEGRDYERYSVAKAK